jgi:hypothetical protein
MAKEYKRPGSIGAVQTVGRLFGAPTTHNPTLPADRASEAVESHESALSKAVDAAAARRFNRGSGNNPFVG